MTQSKIVLSFAAFLIRVFKMFKRCLCSGGHVAFVQMRFLMFVQE